MLLLAGRAFYPEGWDDFRGAFSDVRAAVDALSALPDEVEWAQIIDRDTLRVVESLKKDRPWIPCQRCRGAGKTKTHVQEMTRDGLRAMPVLVRCSTCGGSRGAHGPYGWHKDET